MADNTTELSVEDCLRELSPLFPRETWITCRATVRQTGNPEIGRYAEIEIDDESFRAATLNEAKELVRQWHAEQARESKG